MSEEWEGLSFLFEGYEEEEKRRWERLASYCIEMGGKWEWDEKAGEGRCRIGGFVLTFHTMAVENPLKREPYQPPIRRFVGFAFDTYYPIGGFEDFAVTGDTLKGVLEELGKKDRDYLQVVDLEEGIIMYILKKD